MPNDKMKNEPSKEEIEILLASLQNRFKKHMNRHIGLDWDIVESRLRSNKEKLRSLYDMERTGGEPDVIDCDKNTDEYFFYDCAPESPKGRRSLCYDNEAFESRKEHKPDGSAVGLAADMGIEILTEKQYRNLQKLEKFDIKTSSWIITPPEIRKLGGAIFADRRYDTVFIYHNGAESYYASRGFRGSLRV